MNIEAFRREAQAIAVAKGLPELAERLEEIGVLQTVRALEEFWRPPIVRYIILAESHVCSDREQWEEHNVAVEVAQAAQQLVQAVYKRVNKRPPASKFPTNYVRYIYGLGYGDAAAFADIAPSGRSSFTRFWKLLSYAGGIVTKDAYNRGELEQENPAARLRAKLAVFAALMASGYWLLQASYFGLYVPKDLRWNGKARPFNRREIEDSLVEISQKDITSRLKELDGKGALQLESVDLLGAKAKKAWPSIEEQLFGNKIKVHSVQRWPHPSAIRAGERWDDARWNQWFEAHR